MAARATTYLPKATLAVVAAPLLAAGTAPPPGADAMAAVEIGRTLDLGMVKVTPLQVLEDSRCVAGESCTGGDALRLRVMVDSPEGSHAHELTLDRPVTVTGGALTLQRVRPKAAAEPPDDASYRFTLSYAAAR